MSSMKGMSGGTLESRLGMLGPGQGTQTPGMFKALLDSTNPYVRQAAQEIIEVLLKSIRPEVFELYYGSDPDLVEFNSTVNVQPALAAVALTWKKALDMAVGEETRPDFAGGFSLGDYVATNFLGVLTAKQVLETVAIRGDTFAAIKPGKHTVTTLVMKDPRKERGHILSRLNLIWNEEGYRTGHINSLLAGTGYRVTIRLAPTLVTIGGKTLYAKKLEERLNDGRVKSFVRKKLDLSPEVFNVAFHQASLLKVYAAQFEQALIDYCEEQAVQGKGPVFKNPKGVFVTNDGAMLRDGTAIFHYLRNPHIRNICNFVKTMRVMGNHAGTVVCLGDMEKATKAAGDERYIQKLVVVNDDNTGFYSAVKAITAVLNARAKEQTTLSPAYASRQSPALSTASR